MASMDGKVVAITGAASGIGLATAITLASRGAALALTDLRQGPLDDAAGKIKSQYSEAKVHTTVMDVTKADQVAAWLDAVLEEFGKIDGAVNSAGIVGSAMGKRNVAALDDSDFDSVMDVNVKGVFNCVRAELQRMKEGSSIVNLASVAGVRGVPLGAVYAMSKHAVVGLTTSAARDFAAAGIRVNVVAPGSIESPMLREVFAKDHDPSGEEAAAATKSLIPMSRFGEPSEVAKLIAYLLSDESTYTTGSVQLIDGGWCA